MKKYLLLLIKIYLCQMAIAQTVLENFESAVPQLNWQVLGGIEVLHGKFTAPTANPAADGSNSSAGVGCYQKGISPFSTLVATVPGGLDLKDFAKLELDVLPPVATGEVLLEVFSNSGNRKLKTQTAAAGQWQTLTFDFSGFTHPLPYSEIRLTFNFGTAAEGENWCIDNLRQSKGSGDPCSGVQPQPNIVEDFDCQHNYAKIFYGASDISAVNNPYPTPENPSPKVGEYKDPANSQWAGVGFEFNNPINLTSLNILEVKIWSPTAGIPMLFKLEGGTGTGVEVWQNVPQANQWVTYRIDFSAAKPFNHRKLVIFCNAGVNAPSTTYFWDDIRWTTSTSVSDANDNAAARRHLTIFPNPTTDFFQLQILEGDIVGRVVVADELGRHQLEWTGEETTHFDVSRLSSGSYVVMSWSQHGKFLGAGRLLKN